MDKGTFSMNKWIIIVTYKLQYYDSIVWTY